MVGGMLSPGTILGGDFRVLEPLQAGGMGAVYVAEQLSTGQRRALKIMHPTLVQDPRLRERFEQEARVGSRVASEHVVQVIAAGVDATLGIPWIAMELLRGETLAEMIERQGRVGFDRVLAVFRPLCHALAAAHAVGIVHRDIKPENVFVAASQSADREMAIKVLDFGIAKLVAEAREHGTANIGTPLWMAPEQTDPRLPIGPTTDVWPLGLIAYRMLTGRHYWRSASDPAGSVQSLMREGLVEPLVAASVRASEQGVAGQLPTGFDAWFARCVNRDPGARFSGAGEAYAALEGIAPSISAAHFAFTPPALPSAPPKRSHGGVIAIGMIALLGLVGLAVAAVGVGAYFFLFQESSPVAATPVPTAVSVDAGAPVESSQPESPVAATSTATTAPSKVTQPPPAKTASKTGAPETTASAPPASAAPSSELAPFNRSQATAKVNAAVAKATSSCKHLKGDASVESYKGSIGFRPDGTRSMGFQGPGGSRQCVYDILSAVRMGKYAPNPEDPWGVDVVTFVVTIQ